MLFLHFVATSRFNCKGESNGQATQIAWRKTEQSESKTRQTHLKVCSPFMRGHQPLRAQHQESGDIKVMYVLPVNQGGETRLLQKVKQPLKRGECDGDKRNDVLNRIHYSKYNRSKDSAAVNLIITDTSVWIIALWDRLCIIQVVWDKMTLSKYPPSSFYPLHWGFPIVATIYPHIQWMDGNCIHQFTKQCKS